MMFFFTTTERKFFSHKHVIRAFSSGELQVVSNNMRPRSIYIIVLTILTGLGNKK